MAFTYANNQITQTGTDTNLSGLVGMSGVTTFSTGGTSTGIMSPKTIYRLDNRELIVNGSLTYDAKVEELSFTDTVGHARTIRLNNGATLTVTGTFDYAGQTDVETFPVAFRVNKPDAGGGWNNPGTNYLLRAETGSTLNLNGVSLGAQHNMLFNGSGTIKNILITGRDHYRPLILFNSSNYTVDGLTIVGTHGLIFGRNNGIVMRNLRVRSTGKTTQHDSTGWTTPNLVPSFATFQDYIASEGWQGDFRIWWNGCYKVENSDSGSDIDVALNGVITVPNIANGFCWVTKKVKPLYKNLAGSPIQDVLTYIQDVNNGSRRSLSQIGLTNTTLNAAVPNFLNTRTYSNLSNVNGEGNEIEVTTAVWTGASADGYAQGQWDYRGANNNNSDIFNVRAVHYNYLLTTATPALLGLGTLDLSNVLFSDALVTEANRTVVDAYTELDTSQKVYDRAKSYLTANYANETQTIVGRSANSLDARALDVVIDATASSAFAISSNTLTIKASTFTGDMTTTGVITLANGAAFSGTRTDANGTIVVTTLSLIGLQANSEVRVYIAGTTTEIAGVENSGTTFTTTVSVGSVDIVVHSLGYEYQRIEGADTSANLTLPIQQRVDRNYRNP
jgi:hypothetical protein